MMEWLSFPFNLTKSQNRLEIISFHYHCFRKYADVQDSFEVMFIMSAISILYLQYRQDITSAIKCDVLCSKWMQPKSHIQQIKSVSERQTV